MCQYLFNFPARKRPVVSNGMRIFWSEFHKLALEGQVSCEERE